MKPAEYIQSKLNELKTESLSPKTLDREVLKREIFRLLMSKKFRKYSVTPEYQSHIKEAIRLNVDNNEPIKLVYPFGGYKLWRLKESPEVDWAELFTLIYYGHWLKPICDVYEPGAEMDFYSDGEFIWRMNNLDAEDPVKYKASFLKIIDFIKNYLPKNLQIRFSMIADQYESPEEFETLLQERIEEMREEFGRKLPIIDEETKSSIELNVRPSKEAETDPLWREKNHILHKAYLGTPKRREYWKFQPKKIAIFSTQLFPSIVLGSTKRSIAKFWCGVGVLEQNGEEFNQLVLSPSQIEKKEILREKIEISGLDGRNFETIGIRAQSK